MQTTVYGLADALRMWYLTLQKTLLKAGARKRELDEAVFFWSYEGNLEGVICCHVDDILLGGSVTFNSRIIQVIKDTFHISQESLGSFKYVGLNITQDEDFTSVHQYGYVSEVKEIEITKESASQRREPLTIEEARQLRKVAGQLNWASSQSCPDMAYESCILSTSLKNGTVQDLLKYFHRNSTGFLAQ